MKLETARRKYKGEWIAFKYENGTQSNGTVIVHHTNRHEFHKMVIAQNIQSQAYLTYNAPVVPKGFALAL